MAGVVRASPSRRPAASRCAGADAYRHHAIPAPMRTRTNTIVDVAPSGIAGGRWLAMATVSEPNCDAKNRAQGEFSPPLKSAAPMATLGATRIATGTFIFQPGACG